ncbi:hypothetical protein QNI16_30450 [Cytophagaceae bacterium YF14B1]|uniref:Uncharacterized protein n=1 Tax=Xanthocytophaga flava TaxID=3048013 RepID=A0AAE3QT23_9BACT|nr:hypothetical protein [Xanthocytophaga flavus]MDJ1484860.1 hypothetical protein [Xanthocytophaga flavus]
MKVVSAQCGQLKKTTKTTFPVLLKESRGKTGGLSEWSINSLTNQAWLYLSQVSSRRTGRRAFQEDRESVFSFISVVGVITNDHFPSINVGVISNMGENVNMALFVPTQRTLLSI